MPKADYGTNVKVNGLERVKAFLAEVPRGTKRAALAAATEYFLGNDRRGLRHYAPWKFIGRPKAYGQQGAVDAPWNSKSGAPIPPPPGYFSWKQFYFVMIKIHQSGYEAGAHNRTGKTAAGWAANFTSDGYRARLFNQTEGAKWITGDTTQARQPKLVGHRKLMDVITANATGAIRAGQQAVDRWLKEHK